VLELSNFVPSDKKHFQVCKVAFNSVFFIVFYGLMLLHIPVNWHVVC
jgi:hypothetical protein